MNSASRAMSCEDRECLGHRSRLAPAGSPEPATATQPHQRSRNAPEHLAATAGHQEKRAADPLMQQLMARLDAEAAAQAGHFDIAAGRRKFMSWLAGSSDTPGEHSAAPGPVRPADRLDVAHLRYSPVLTRKLLGSWLRRLREASGILAADAAYQIRASPAKISRMELGRISFKERDVTDLLHLYGVTDPHERDTLLYLTRHANEDPWWSRYSDVLPGWFEAYVALEEVAAVIRTYDAGHIPALLQTEDYARAFAQASPGGTPDWEIGRRLQMLKERQALLTRYQAPRLWVLIDEAALRRPVGGPDVMPAQLRYLAQAGSLPGVAIQVVPLSSEAGSVPEGSFTLLRFAEPDLPDVVYIETLTGALYLDRKPDVERHAEVLDLLVSSAAPLSETTQIIEDFFREWSRA